MAEPYIEQVEYLDVLTKTGKKTGVSKPRGDVHRDGDYHKAVHVWIFAESTQELLLQKRADYKDSWPGLWDISSAGHISAGDSSLITAQRELQEELGVILPKDAFELIFIFLEECVTNNGKFINNEYSDVYRVTTLEPISREAFTLQGEKDWTRRIGNDRHLICIEDPFVVSHDLGRVMDKFSIKVLREEFERVADVMQCDPNLWKTLFEP